ncbi:hypothetical protein K8R04_03870 [Candidatus Uhrbacteria bacterium]|nr:hypothetical protein [Candidatus Uhrbacteria bacterium]
MPFDLPSNQPAPGREKPKAEKPVSFEPSQEMMIAAVTPAEAREKKSRKTMLERIRAVDEVIFRKIGAETGDISKHIEQIEVLESLATGKQKERKRLGDAGINAILRMKFEREGGGEVVGFMKQKSGEAYFDKDGTNLIYSASDEKYFRDESSEVDPTQKMIAEQWSSEEFIQEYAVQMAKAYGIPSEEFEKYKASLRVDRFGPRIDIPPEGFIAREVAMSRVDMLCGFDVIPPTAAREIDRMVMDEEQGTKIVKDLASVQEGVSSIDSENPSRFLTAKEFDAFQEQPPSEWHKIIGIEYTPEELAALEKDGRLPQPQESMARLATLDWVMGSQDRHFENMFIDPVSGKVTGIDNGLHSGRARDLKIRHGREETVVTEGKRVKQKSDPTEGMRQLRSIPLEIMNAQQELRLSRKDQEQMKTLYEAILNDGPQKEVIEQTYKMMFDDLREAKVQMAKFVARLKYVADNGRPGVTSSEVFPIGQFTKAMHAEKHQEAN